MRSEIQFFMAEADEIKFVQLAAELVDRIDKSSELEWLLMIGECPIQFLRSQLWDDVITSGRLSIVTTGTNLNHSSAAEAERIYNQLRRSIKKDYSNAVECRNLLVPDSTTTVRNFWIGPALQHLLTSSEGLQMKQDRFGNVVFNLVAGA